MDYIFYQVAAVNGFDSFGHYLRARPDRQPCSRYLRDAPVAGCSANFAASAAQRRRRQRDAPPSAGGDDPVLEPATAARARTARTPSSGAALQPKSRDAATGAQPRKAASGRRPTSRRLGGSARDPAPALGDAPAPDATRGPRSRADAPATRRDRAAARLPVRGGRRMRSRGSAHRRQPGPDRRRDGARGHRRRVPVLQRQRGPAVRARPTSSRPRSRAPPQLVAATTCGSAARASARSTTITPKRRDDGTSVAVLGLKLERGVDPLPKDSTLHHPPAVGARPQVRRDHARQVERGLRGRRHDPAARRPRRRRSSSTSS